MRLCLDTSAYSRFMGGSEEAVSRIDAAEWVGMPTIVIGELSAGFRLGSRTARNLEELDRFLDHSVVEELAVDREVADIYGEIVVQLRRNGTPHSDERCLDRGLGSSIGSDAPYPRRALRGCGADRRPAAWRLSGSSAWSRQQHEARPSGRASLSRDCLYPKRTTCSR